MCTCILFPFEISKESLPTILQPTLGDKPHATHLTISSGICY